MSYQRWSIWLANLDPIVGSEQGKTRPVLILSDTEINDLLNVVNVLPLTTRKNNRAIYPNEVLLEASKFGLPNESVVLCFQIRTLDKKRLMKKMGEVKDSIIQTDIEDAVCFQLAIDK